MTKTELKTLASKYKDIELKFNHGTVEVNGSKFFNINHAVDCIVEDFEKKDEVKNAEKIQNRKDFERSNSLMNKTLFGI